MSHSELHRLEYSFVDKIPQIPIRLFGKDAKGGEILTPPIKGVLDSGASRFTISKSMAEFLKMQLKKVGKGDTAGNQVDSFAATGSFVIGLGEKSITYSDVYIAVLDSDTPILVGIDPVWRDFVVTIDASGDKLVLEPRK